MKVKAQAASTAIVNVTAAALSSLFFIVANLSRRDAGVSNASTHDRYGWKAVIRCRHSIGTGADDAPLARAPLALPRK